MLPEMVVIVDGAALKKEREWTLLPGKQKRSLKKKKMVNSAIGKKGHARTQVQTHGSGRPLQGGCPSPFAKRKPTSNSWGKPSASQSP